uniref:Uncharacterized protein n=1 Tax=Raoultella planticola TaxID=575 RepID=W8CUS4_RAOPL|nr:hypothetical protein pKpNDM1_00505 [Raoultella planticola]
MKKREKIKKEKKNMSIMCTVVTHAERGAAEQMLCRAGGMLSYVCCIITDGHADIQKLWRWPSPGLTTLSHTVDTSPGKMPSGVFCLALLAVTALT